MTTTTSPATQKPTPRPSELNAPFWAAAGEHRLVIQRCQACGYFNHPPMPLCDRCSSDDLKFEQVSGRGRIYSYTVMHQKTIAGFADDIPYVTAIVELEEQPLLLLLTNLPGSNGSGIPLGHPVEVQFEASGGQVTLPQFRLAANS
jgi:uncharacterized OB-fold protein